MWEEYPFANKPGTKAQRHNFLLGRTSTEPGLALRQYARYGSKKCLQENIDAQHQWRRKSVVSEIEHITAG